MGRWDSVLEYVGVQACRSGIVGEEVIQALSRLPQKEAFHLVPGLGVWGPGHC